MVEKSEKCKLNCSGILLRKPNFSGKEVFKFQWFLNGFELISMCKFEIT
jgi:hypothetical protein